MYQELEAIYPDHLPLHIARLQALDGDKVTRDVKAITATADAIIKSIDATELLGFYGLKFDARPDAAKIKTYYSIRNGLKLKY